MSKKNNNKANKPRKEYNIGDEVPRKPLSMPIDERMVIVCRPLIQKYKTTSLHKQFFKLMEWCKDNDTLLPKGAAIAILRKSLDTNPIRREELDHFNSMVFDFRKWLGVLAGMVVYQFKGQYKGKKQVLFRPLKNKKEYMTIVGKHMELVDSGIRNRHQSNLDLFKMTDRQIQKLIDETSNQVDIEVDLPPKDRKKRNRK